MNRLTPEIVLAAVLVAATGAHPQEVEPSSEEIEEGVDANTDPFSDEGLDELLSGDVPEDASGEAGRDSVLEAWKGFVEIKPRVYFFDRDEGKNDGQILFEAEFEFDFRFTDSVSGFFRPRIYVDALDGDLKRFEPYEGYVTLEGETWDLRGGQFIENWGIVDTFNPIDVVNRRDLATDILDPTRLGELGLRLRYLFDGNDTFGEPTLSAYALPVFRETLFPPKDQRFGFESDDGLRFEEDDGFEPDGLEQGLYALRLQSTLNTRPVNADVQLLAARGPERMPTLSVEPGGVLIPVYYGALTFGAGFRAVPNQDVLGEFLSTLTLKAEVVYKDLYGFEDSPIETPDDYVSYVVGVDRAFYNVLRDQDQITLTLEYAGEEGASDPSTLLRPFRDDIIARALWEANDFSRTSVELRGIYDFETDEVIVEAVLERQLRSLHEDIKLTVQLQFFDPPGTEESFFDLFPDNSSLALGLRWDF